MIEELNRFSDQAKSLAAALELADQVKNFGGGAVRISFSQNDGQGVGKMFKLPENLKVKLIEKLEGLIAEEVSELIGNTKSYISSIEGDGHGK